MPISTQLLEILLKMFQLAKLKRIGLEMKNKLLKEWHLKRLQDGLIQKLMVKDYLLILTTKLGKWSSENIQIISISPITSGSYNYQFSSQGISSSPRLLSDTEKVSGGGSYGFGYGYSYTEGVLICIEIL